MNTQNLALGLVVVLAFTGAYLGSKRPVAVERVVETVVGAVPGGDFYNPVTFRTGVEHKFSSVASTSNASLTLVARDIVNDGVLLNTIIHEPIVGDVTITFPASSSLSHILKEVGATARQCWTNGTTTSGIDITFAAGAGIDFLTASSSITGGAPILTALADQEVCFDFTRKYRNVNQKTTAGDISAKVTRFVDGD